MLPAAPGFRVSVAHSGLLSGAALWAAVSLFVQVIVSPTLACTGSVVNVKLLISTWTEPAVADLAQTAAAAVPPDEAAGALVAGVAPEPQAASAIATASVRPPRTIA